MRLIRRAYAFSQDFATTNVTLSTDDVVISLGDKINNGFVSVLSRLGVVYVAKCDVTSFYP